MEILILAGGRGTRLWPLSRKSKPKQFQRVISSRTMLQETVARLLPKFPLEDIFISTNREYAKEVESEIAKLPKKNIVVEPVSRERLAGIALFLTTLKKKSREPVLIMPSDHLIKKTENFRKAISAGKKFVEKNPKYILILGEKPTFPDTGLGYIKKGELLTTVNENKIHRVSFFKEKPNLKRTKLYLKNGNYLWNTAIYLLFPSLIEKQMKKFVPDNYARYKKIKAAAGKAGYQKILLEEYPKMDPVSFEYAILENYKDIAVVPVDLGWSDVGSWTALKNCLSSPGKNFARGNYVGFDSKNVMVYGSFNKLVAGVGIKDLIVVLTDDIVLICHKDGSQKIKEVIKKLEKQKKFDYI